MIESADTDVGEASINAPLRQVKRREHTQDEMLRNKKVSNTFVGSEDGESLARATNDRKNSAPPHSSRKLLLTSARFNAVITPCKPSLRLSGHLASEINCLRSTPPAWTDQAITATVSSAYTLIETISPLIQKAMPSAHTEITSDFYEEIVDRALHNAGVSLSANEISQQLNAAYLSERFGSLVEADPDREMIVLNALEFFNPHSILTLFR